MIFFIALSLNLLFSSASSAENSCVGLSYLDCHSENQCKWDLETWKCIPKQQQSANLRPNKTPLASVGFAGCGFLGVYELGALAALEEHGAIVRGTTLIAGGSAGAILTAAWCAYSPIPLMSALLFDLLEKCGKNGLAEAKCNGHYEELNRELLNKAIPKGPFWKNCNATASIQFTEVQNTKTCPPQTLQNRIIGWDLVTNFFSKSDLIDAASASSFIWAFSAPPTQCSTQFRNMYGIDAGYSNVLPCPNNANNSLPFSQTGCLKISGEPPDQWYGEPVYQAEIYPSVQGTYPKGLTQQDYDNNLWANVVKVNQYKYSLYKAGFLMQHGGYKITG